MMELLDIQLRKVSNAMKRVFGALLVIAFMQAFAQTSFAENLSPEQLFNAQAQIQKFHQQRRNDPNGKQPLLYINGRYTGNNPGLKAQIELEERLGLSISESIGYREEVEPIFEEVKFYEMPIKNTMQSNMESVLHGVTVVLPPKYDLHGYEIRRYMAKIAGPDVLADQKKLAAQVANTKRAKIVLNDWEEKLSARLQKVEEQIEADDTIDGTTRSNFKYNKGRMRAFLVEAHSWIDNNQKMLEFLFEIYGAYTYEDPAINFARQEDLDKFKSLFNARQKSVEIMQEYVPFRMMIY